MKNAVIAVGSHYAGKSRTLKKFVKPKLGIGERELYFRRNGYTFSIKTKTNSSFHSIAEFADPYLVIGFSFFGIGGQVNICFYSAEHINSKISNSIRFELYIQRECGNYGLDAFLYIMSLFKIARIGRIEFV